jgi:hypothetical protein
MERRVEEEKTLSSIEDKTLSSICIEKRESRHH